MYYVSIKSKLISFNFTNSYHQTTKMEVKLNIVCVFTLSESIIFSIFLYFSAFYIIQVTKNKRENY